MVDELRRQMRAYDLVVRLGGDEFLCVLAGVALDDARRRFTPLSDDPADGTRGWTVTVGLAQLRDDDSPEALVDRADQALLAARRARAGERAGG